MLRVKAFADELYANFQDIEKCATVNVNLGEMTQTTLDQA